MLFSCRPLAARSAMTVRRSRGAPRPFTVDIHCHLQTPEAAALMKDVVSPATDPLIFFSNAATAEVNRKQNDAIQPQLTSIERRLADMDKAGIDVQAVSPAPFQYYYWAEPERALQAARLVNERIAQVQNDHPDRFAGLGTVPMQAPELAVRELTRLVKELGLRGVEINTNVAGEELSHERFRPFFAKAEELDVLIFMHPSGFTEGRRLADHYFSNVIGNPLDTTVAVSHLIFGGVLDRHPKLKICLAHGGGFLPAYSGRMDHAHAARPDCRRVIKRRPTSYLKKLYFDTIVFTHHQLEYLVEQWGADHLLLGTDYPYDMALPNAVGFVQGAKVARADQAAILGGNAARLLKIKPPAAAKKAPAKKKALAKKKTAAKRRAAGKAPAKKASAKKRAKTARRR
jgi:aminocarboxymuconate-semialdehyde decarboxylase